MIDFYLANFINKMLNLKFTPFELIFFLYIKNSKNCFIYYI
jgi:hypothetical protein